MSDYGVDYTKTMFGEHAIHVPMQIVLQDAGYDPDTGVDRVCFVGVASSHEPLLSETARAMESPHELIVGDMVIRPLGKSTHIGEGLGSFPKSEAIYPSGWTHQTLENGYTAAMARVEREATDRELYTAAMKRAKLLRP